MAGAATFRRIQPGDEEFLCTVYASTRTEELARVNWSPAEKAAFLRMQFEAQHQHYQSHFPNADFLVVLLRGHPIGRLYVARMTDEFRIVDIALLPEHRSRGIGSALLMEILAEATAVNKPVRIHVERFNPALSLYQRLGFSVVNEGQIYLLLEKRP